MAEKRLLRGSMYDIAVGRSKLSLDKVAEYRRLFESIGFELPAYEGPPLPSLPALAANYIKAEIAHTAAGRQQTTPEEKKRRLDICRSNKCGMATLVNESLRCAHPTCGCFLETKAGWAEQTCPLTFW